ncbi:nucleoside-diphosphate-sugar epimerase [Kribbella steppae]|uniref:Nucleoside-diphosphate-sugar epimerase n=2 Tax=Kribbella steppae TaxID=2512223 RepID=A0A4R2HTN6_9ACTN|nr:nucleoside-diphosphate-sugar epimerase [Kribbella steppae]
MPGSSPQFVAESVSANADAASMRVVVLGTSGFMGQHCAQILADRGINHLRVGRTPGTNVDVGLDLVRSPQAELVDLLRSYEPTSVINCAGAVRGTAGEMMRTNVASVHSLVSAAFSAAPTARIVQLGSSAEYGAPDGQHPIDESAEERPSSPYGYSKLAATQIALHARSQGLAITVLRIFNVSGPLSPTSTMLGGAVARLRSGEPLIVDSLDGWRDYVDVRDVAAAAVATTYTEEAPPLLNIGSGRAVRTGDWLKRLIEISETRAEPVVGADPQRAHKSSAAEVSWQCADISLARRSLNWSPQITLDQSLRDTWLAATDR